MKSVLYIGAALMVGACIYGFVDYKSNNPKKEMNKMYSNKSVATKSLPAPEQVVEVKTIDKPIPSAVSRKSTNEQVKEKKTAGAKKKVTRNKKLNIKKYSRAALVEEVESPERQQ